MSFRTARGYKVILWLLTLACLSGAGYLGYRTFFATSSPAQHLKAAESAYARGANAYEQKNWGDAATRFDEAKIHADNAKQSFDEMAKDGKMQPDEAKSLHERIMWVKARAMRDHAYAKAQLDGKPLNDVPDPQYRETFRPFGLIPDEKVREEAINALFHAARQTSDPEILKEAIRSDLVLGQRNWHLAEPLLRAAVKLDPKDARSHYYLARYEYDQPQADNMTPTPGDKKSSERVELARDHLAAAKANGSPYWRTVGLEAEILNWSVQTAAARKLKPDAVAAAERALDQMLFDPGSGAVGAAARGDKFAGMGTADGPAVTGVLKIAMDRATAEARKPGGSVDRVRTVSNAALDVAKKMADDAAMRPFLPVALTTLTELTAAAQQYLAKADPGAWREHTAGVQAVLTKAADTARGLPKVKFLMAQVSLDDALLVARAGNSDQARAQIEKALAQADEGLKAAEAGNLPANQTDEFHLTLAEWKLMTGAKSEAIAPHLARLHASTIPKAKLHAQFLDARIAERQGRLDKARKLLIPLAADRTPAHRDLAARANMFLANLNMVLGDPAAALACLREVEPVLEKLEELPPIERAWREELGFGGLDDNIAQQIRANLAVALQIAARHTRENPKTPVPGELIEGHLLAARNLQKKLRGPSATDRAARLAVVNFHLLTNRKNEAEAQLNELVTDYPDSIDVLRVRCSLLAAPVEPGSRELNPNGVAAADALIRKFLKDYPTDKGGKLFNAEWLVSTKRADRAVEYLKDPANFPGGRDGAANRLLSAALLQTGQREEAQKILSTLPSDPNLDAVLIRMAVTREAGEKHLKEALSRYENQGRFRVYEAAMKLSEKKYEEALKGFASAIEFTEVGKSAKAGLVLTLGVYAIAEPSKARDAAIRLANEMPDEPGLYLAAADAALHLNEVGDPSDRWDQTKTMYAAVNKWESVALKAGTPRGDTVLTKARARLLAGDPDGAKREAVNALAQDPEHVPTMVLLAELHLMPPVDTARVRELHDAAHKRNPNHPTLPYIDARVKELSGDWAGAAAVYQRLLADAPTNPAPYGPLVAALDAAGQKDVALRHAQDWHSKYPDDARAVGEVIRLLILAGKRPDAIKVADEFVTKQVTDTRKRMQDSFQPVPEEEAKKRVENVRAAALLATGSGFFRARAFDVAEARAVEILKGNPAHTAAMLVLGDIAVANKQWDKALAVYREVLKQNQRHFIAGNNLAWILAEQKNDPAGALVVVEEIRKGAAGDKPIGPERLPADFLDTIGVVYLKLNKSERFAEMRTIFEAAARRYPADPRMYLYLGHAQAALGERSKALESLDAATRLAGTKNGLPEDQNKAVIDGAEAARKKLRG
jgi:predicted Zn-dependent protease